MRILLAALLEALQDEGSLLGDDALDVEVVHVGVHVALHERAAVVVLDVPHPPVTHQRRERWRQDDRMRHKPVNATT